MFMHLAKFVLGSLLLLFHSILLVCALCSSSAWAEDITSCGLHETWIHHKCLSGGCWMCHSPSLCMSRLSVPASSCHMNMPWYLHLRAEQPGALCRYVMPLLVAATFAGSLKYVLGMRQWSAWVTPASGVLLLAGGTYSLLSRAFPA